MTIPSTSRKAGPLLGTGAQTAWPFTFKVFAESDIAVAIADSLGIETALVLDTDYSVTLNANQETSPGGTVTYPISGTPLAVGGKLSIIGDLDYDQPLDLPSGGNFSPLALENELDRLTMQIQQVKETAGRALLVPVTSTASSALPAPEANKLIAWNETASALQNLSVSEIASVVAYGTAASDIFTGTGAQTAFVLSNNPGALNNLDVAIGGVTQLPGVDYTWTSGTTVTFTTAPPNGAKVLIRYMQALALGTADAGSVQYTPAGTGAVATTAQAKLRESVSASDYTTLAAAVAAIGETATTLNITSAVSISSNLTIPSNVIVRFESAGFVTITGSSTLTINGPFEAPAKQIFSTPTCTKGNGVGPVLATITNGVVFAGISKPVVNPRWFGAGGTANDWAALQSAVWSVTPASPGITLQLEQGVTYTIDKSIVIDTAYFRLLGATNAVIFRKNSTPVDTMCNLDTGHEGRYTWGSIYPIIGIEIEGVNLDGNKANNSVGVDDTYDLGISALYLSKSRITNCRVYNVERFGIAVSNSNDVIVSGNLVEGCNENGIYAETGARITFSNNQVRDCSTSTWNMGAISMSNITNGVISDNVVVAGYDGIFIRNACYNVTITGNSVSGSGRYGIWLKDESDAFSFIPENITVAGNSVTQTTSFPYLAELARKVTVSGNTFNTLSAAYCLRFRNGQDQTFEANVLTGFATSAIDPTGAGNARTFITGVSGTWTPTLLGLTTAGTGTYSIQTGRYTYSGNRIIYSALINQSAHTGTGQAALTLPFTINASDTVASALVEGYNFAYTGWLNGIGANTTNYIRVHTNNGGTLSATPVPGAASIYYSGQFEFA